MALGFTLGDLACEHDLHLDMVQILRFLLNELIDVIESFDGFLKFLWRLIDQLFVS